MKRRDGHRFLRALPLWVGGDLDAATRENLEARIAQDEDLAEAAGRHERAYRDLLSLRECRPAFDSDDDLWGPIRARLAFGERPPTRREPVRILRALRSPAVRWSGIAAVIVLSFVLGFSIRDGGGLFGLPRLGDLDGSREGIAGPVGGAGSSIASEGVSGERDRVSVGAEWADFVPQNPGAAFPGRNLLVPVSDPGVYDF